MSVLKDILSSIGHLPKRSLGQNFLVDKNCAEWVVRKLDPLPGEEVLEIGPGLGALTEFVVARPEVRCTLLEKDSRLCAFLREKFDADEVRIEEGDALDFPIRQLWTGRPVALLGNLPYNVSTALLTKFCGPDSPVRRAVVTVQKEVADRLCAKAGTSEFGGYSVLMQRWWNCRRLKTLGAELFHPRPRVDSAVVWMERKPPGEIIRCDGSALERMVRAGFQQRRKQLRKLLPIEQEAWAAAAEALGFSRDARAESLDPAQWQHLVARTAPGVRDHNPADSPGGVEIFDVVDESDRVIGTAPRPKVHAGHLRHRAAHILIRGSDGSLYLQRRAPWKDINPWIWDSSAAGHLDSGETYEQAAVRELREELGIETELQRIGKLEPSEATGNEFIEVFAGIHDGPFDPAGLEIVAGDFFPVDQLTEWIAAAPSDFSPVFLECWKLPRVQEFVRR